MIRAFLDTSVLLDRVLMLSKEADHLFRDRDIERFTNEIALKELYHVLKKSFGYSEAEISYVIEYIRETCTVLPTPSKKEIQSIRVRDRSDRPFVLSAKKFGLILYIDDEMPYQDAQDIVEVRRVRKDKR
jgi:predicted nucleic acid-binding protein